MVLRRDPICLICREKPSTQVDHIIAKPEGRDTLENLQGLCESCHSRKTISENTPSKVAGTDRAAITIVCGPPGSGKSGYVHKRLKWGDLVLDIDLIYQAISGLPYYQKPECLLPFAFAAEDAIIKKLSLKNDVRHAWIIMGGAKREHRQRLQTKLQPCEMIILNTSPPECLERISKDPRRKDSFHLWEPMIDKWWQDFEKGGGGVESLRVSA